MSGEKGVLPSYTINIQSQAMIKMLLVLCLPICNVTGERRKREAIDRKREADGQKERQIQRETEKDRQADRGKWSS